MFTDDRKMCVVVQHNLGKGGRAAPVASPCVPAHSGIEPSCAGRVSWAAHPWTAAADAPAVAGNLGVARTRDTCLVTGKGGSLRAAPLPPHDQGDLSPPWTPIGHLGVQRWQATLTEPDL